MTKVSWNHLTLVGVKSALSLFALLVITVIIHEGAHYVTALILRIPIAHFALFDPEYFAPVFYSDSIEYTAGMAIVGYAGGIFTGLILLSILIFRWNWFKQSLYRWFLGLYLATFGAWQISQGILEGAFHQAYILNGTKLFFSPTHYIGYASAFVGMSIYWLFMPPIKGKENGKSL